MDERDRQDAADALEPLDQIGEPGSWDPFPAAASLLLGKEATSGQEASETLARTIRGPELR